MRHKRQALQDMARPLKQWLYMHRDNPYPTKTEKILLALGSQMTLVQVIGATSPCPSLGAAGAQAALLLPAAGKGRAEIGRSGCSSGLWMMRGGTGQSSNAGRASGFPPILSLFGPGGIVWCSLRRTVKSQVQT